MQAGILAAAGMVTRIIGLLYRSPLHSVIGKLGDGYYSSAYNFYTIILLISSYSIPSAISKVLAQKLAVEEYRNAHRLFKCALFYVLGVGAAASLFLFFAAELFVSPEAVPVLRTFAPTIFVYGILGVLRGYFQAQRTMVPTSVSQIIEQIANAVISVGGAYVLIHFVLGDVSGLPEKAAQVQTGVYGAVGSAIGTGAGVVAALLFMLFVFFASKKHMDKKILADTHTEVDSYGTIMKTIFLVVTPFIINTAVCNLSSNVNNTLYTKIYPAVRGLDTLDTYSAYGLYSLQAVTISNIPIAFATAMAAAMIPTVAQLIAAQKREVAKDKIALAVKATMVISIPCAVGLFTLAAPVTSLLFRNPPEDELVAAKLLMALSLSVIFFAYSTLNSQILQGLGKVNAPIVNAGIALVVQSILAAVLLFFTPLDMYSIAIASTVYSGLLCFLNQRSVHKAIGYEQEIENTFIRPLTAAVLMGVFCKIIYSIFFWMTRSPKLSVLIAIVIGAGFYFAVLVLLKGVTEEELRSFPKGHLLVKIAKKCRLIR